MRAKRKLLISMLAIVFVLLAVVATIAIAFALTQQTITTTLNIGFMVQDIDGTASATFTVGGVTENLIAMKGDTVIGDKLVFKATDTEDAGNLKFPNDALALNSTDDNVVIQYTYSNTGDRHYMASMSFDAELTYENMKVEYSINGVDYSEERYAVVVPANTSNKSYWIRISIDDKAKSASFTGDFNWLLSGCDEQEDSYVSLTSLEFQGSDGSYSAAVVSAGSGQNGKIVYPSEVNGDAVTVISASTLTQAEKNQITSVYIPASVETIRTNAFQNFQKLETVTFEQNETAVASAQSLNGLKIINNSAFYGCTVLNDFKFPNTVTTICNLAFYQCRAITSIEIPASVISILEYPFRYCVSLNSFTVAQGNSVYHSVDNCIIETATKTLISGCYTSVIPTDGTVTAIGNYAFSGCYYLNSFVVPKTITSIGSNNFVSCYSLTSLTVEEGNPVYHSANNCIIDTSAKKIIAASNGFSGIPEDGSVTTIGANSFNGVSRVTELNIPSSVTTIENWAFTNMSALISITIPASVTSIDSSSFLANPSLTTITIDSANPVYHSAGNCIIETATKTLVAGCKASVIPSDASVTSIGSYAFAYNNNVKSMTIPANVIKIKPYIFYSSSNLSSLTFENPNGWTAGSVSISSSDLSNPTTAANLFKTYDNVIWTCATSAI